MKRAVKTEHAGAKNRGGFWGTRRRAKQISKKLRRHYDKPEVISENGSWKIKTKRLDTT